MEYLTFMHQKKDPHFANRKVKGVYLLQRDFMIVN